VVPWVTKLHDGRIRAIAGADALVLRHALSLAGYHQEAAAGREWLLRAVAGDPSKLQIMYGLSGSAGSWSTSSPGCRGTKVPSRYGSAMQRCSAQASSARQRTP
jgi:GH15 family glucan-1,4-alpha-glucosidase